MILSIMNTTPTKEKLSPSKTPERALYLLGAQNKEIGKHEVNPGEYVYMGIDAGLIAST